MFDISIIVSVRRFHAFYKYGNELITLILQPTHKRQILMKLGSLDYFQRNPTLSQLLENNFEFMNKISP